MVPHLIGVYKGLQMCTKLRDKNEHHDETLRCKPLAAAAIIPFQTTNKVISQNFIVLFVCFFIIIIIILSCKTTVFCLFCFCFLVGCFEDGKFVETLHTDLSYPIKKEKEKEKHIYIHFQCC